MTDPPKLERRHERPPKKLTGRQCQFIDEYMVDFNGTQAALRVGYSPKNAKYASRLNMESPHVVAEIARRCNARQLKYEIDVERLQQFFASVVWDPREPVNGGPTMDARLSAGDKLAKILGLYVERSMVANVSLEQLLGEIAEKRKAPKLIGGDVAQPGDRSSVLRLIQSGQLATQ